jgi:hypothetical protein
MKVTMLKNNLREVKNILKEAPGSISGWLSYLKSGPKNSGVDNGTVIKAGFRAFGNIGPYGSSTVVTPNDGSYMTTFFDVDPFSPNMKMLCVTRVPFIDRIPYPGDVADICVVDLETEEVLTLYKTSGWGAQQGANVQFLDDRHVVFNDVVNGQVVGVVVCVDDLTVKYLSGPIYGLSPCRTYSYSGNLQYINALLPGYGVPDPMFGKKRKSSNDEVDGVYRTNIYTGECELFISLQDILEEMPEESDFKRGISYVFNVKASRNGKEIFVVVFAKNIPCRLDRAVQLFRVDVESKQVSVVVDDATWRKGGHHPNWLNGTDCIVMNLKRDAKQMQFVKINPHNSTVEVLAAGVKGGGHPSVSPDGKYLLTDSYVSEGFMDSDGSVPIRIVELDTSTETELTRVFTNRLQGPKRIDPHPVWSRCGRFIVFNAVIDGKRQVVMSEFKRK